MNDQPSSGPFCILVIRLLSKSKFCHNADFQTEFIPNFQLLPSAILSLHLPSLEFLYFWKLDFVYTLTYLKFHGAILSNHQSRKIFKFLLQPLSVCRPPNSVFSSPIPHSVLIFLNVKQIFYAYVLRPLCYFT